MDIPATIKNLITQVRSRGINQALRSLFQRGYARFQEWRLGIYTDTVIELSEFGISDPEYKYYSATDYRSIPEIITALGINPHNHVFLDFGAGMGRAMISAARYPFRRVLGVEISRELTEIAQQNFARCKSKLRCKHIEIATANAITYAIPPDVTLVYFNNPFFGEVLSAVVANLRASLKARPRELLVVCNLPEGSIFESQIKAHIWLSLRKHFRLSENRLCFIYSAALETEASENN
jgi:16S rRNA G966 N2-methylase RsmD